MSQDTGNPDPQCDGGVSTRKAIITAVTIQHLSQGEAARTYGVSKGWVSKLMARYRAEGEAAFDPKSRAPAHHPNRVSDQVVAALIAERDRLTSAGLDAGAETIRWHLAARGVTASRTSIHRTLVRHGKVVHDPSKRPKSSYTRFAADLPNECWQSDFTHYSLTSGADTEIITWEDDHSRYALHISAHTRVTGRIVRDTFRATVAEYGCPASTLTDNGMVYTLRFATKTARSGPQRVRDRTRPPRRDPEERAPEPPDHHREGRTLPTDDEEVARRPARAAGHHPAAERLAGPLPAPCTTRNAPTAASAGAPPPPPTPPCRRRCPVNPRIEPTPGSAPTRSTTARSPSATGASSTPSASAAPTTASRVTALIRDLEITVLATDTGEILRELTLDPNRRYQSRTAENP